MGRVRILIEEADIELAAELNESRTAGTLWEALPLESTAQTWGAEVYFAVPLSCPPDDPQATVPSGAVGYCRPARPSVCSSASSPSAP